jgi:hypothetical protein
MKVCQQMIVGTEQKKIKTPLSVFLITYTKFNKKLFMEIVP